MKFKMKHRGGWMLSVKLVLLFAVASSCAPNEDYYVDVDPNKLTFIIADNASISTFSILLEQSGMDESLRSDQNQVVLAPSDAAFLRKGFSKEVVRLQSAEWIRTAATSHVLEDYIDLKQLPFMTQQKLYTQAGSVIYVTKWLVEQDTVLTVNGVRIYPQVLHASNGRVYVLENMLQPKSYEHILDAIHDQHNFSLFSYAIKQSGLEQAIKDCKSCTVFTPTNAAMAEYGISSFETIRQREADELRELVGYHIQEDYVFTTDLSLTMAMSRTGRFPVDIFYTNGIIATTNLTNAQMGQRQITMMNGSTLIAQFAEGYSGANYGYRLSLIDQGGRVANISPLTKDIVAANGVLHSIDRVLVP